MKKKAFVTLCVLGAGAVASGAAYAIVDPDARFHRREAAQDSIRRTLKDPESAKFYDVTTVKVGGSPYALCGFVNAKNSFGAYVGPRRFYIPLDRHQDLVLAPSAEERGAEDYSNFDGMFATLCSTDSNAVMEAANSILNAPR